MDQVGFNLKKALEKMYGELMSKIKKETDVSSKYISNVVVCISKWNKKLYSVSELLSPLFVLEEGEPVQLVFG